MGVPLLIAVYKKPWQTVNGLLGTPRAVGAGHTFHEYARPEGGYFVLFTRGVAVQITVTLRRPAPSAEKALAALGINPGGRRPITADSVEAVWTGLYGTGGIRARSSSGGRTWETVEVRVKSVAARP